MDSEPMVEDSLGWVGEGKTVKPMVKAKKKGVKRDIEEVEQKETKGDEKSSSSFEFDDVFDVNYNIPS